jgi:hypothetical protein
MHWPRCESQNVNHHKGWCESTQILLTRNSIQGRLALVLLLRMAGDMFLLHCALSSGSGGR